MLSGALGLFCWLLRKRSMSTPNLTLPLDLTGSALSNLVQSEVHAIGPVGTRAFPLNYGLFYRDSLVVTDLATNLPLTEGTQYYPTQMDLDSSLQAGQEVDAVVIIVDTTVSANVSVTYQALGGPNSLNSALTQTAVSALNINDAAVTWASVTNKPKDYAPAPHVHQAGDVFGMEYLTAAMSRLASGITLGQGAAQAQVQAYAQAVVNEMAQIVANGEATLQAHFTCFDNPHDTTAAQVGAYTTEQTTASIGVETANRQAADTSITSNLTAHIANHNDPHQVTPAQLGGNTKAQNDAAMSAMQTAVLASIHANETTQAAHITNYQNPHQTTAAMIGTWTTPQITAAIANSTGTIQTQVNTYQGSLNAHIANTNNPHNDTVGNIGTWAQSTIQSNIVNPSTAHYANTNNPHADSYANIVTSNVDSSGVYSAASMSSSITNNYNNLNGQIASLNSYIYSHTSNYGNPHQDNVSNTGGAYTPGQLVYAISLLQGPGGSAANAINYLASVHN